MENGLNNPIKKLQEYLYDVSQTHRISCLKLNNVAHSCKLKKTSWHTRGFPKNKRKRNRSSQHNHKNISICRLAHHRHSNTCQSPQPTPLTTAISETNLANHRSQFRPQPPIVRQSQPISGQFATSRQSVGSCRK